MNTLVNLTTLLTPVLLAAACEPQPEADVPRVDATETTVETTTSSRLRSPQVYEFKVEVKEP